MHEQAEAGSGPRGARDAAVRGSGTPADRDAGPGFGTGSDIPVRRFGSLPPLDDEPVWEQMDPGRPRTVGDSGGAAVLLVALATAAIVGLLLYLN